MVWTIIRLSIQMMPLINNFSEGLYQDSTERFNAYFSQVATGIS